MIKKHVVLKLLVAGFISGCGTMHQDLIDIPDVDLIPKSDAVNFLRSFPYLPHHCGNRFDTESFAIPDTDMLNILFSRPASSYVVRKYTDLYVLTDKRGIPGFKNDVYIQAIDGSVACIFIKWCPEDKLKKLISAFVSLGAKAKTVK